MEEREGAQMKFEEFDLVASLQALPETDPVEIEGVQFGKKKKGGGGDTCQSACTLLTVNVIQTVCAVFATC